MAGAKKRIAIVGGGCAAMAAAWELTSGDNAAACEVTIFQMGGRLGGKGASSRNTECGNRIEEHGLHVWLGYYDNAFRVLRGCYDELRGASDEGADPELQPYLALRPFDNWNWRSAFERASLVGLADDSSGDWLPWVARFPEYVPESEDGVTGIYTSSDGAALPGIHLVSDLQRAYPGEPATETDATGEPRVNVAFFLEHALRELQVFVESLEERVEQLSTEPPFVEPTEDLDDLLARALNSDSLSDRPTSGDTLRSLRILRLTLLVPTIQAFATVARLAEGPLPFVRSRFVATLDRYIDAMREKIELVVEGDTAARRIWELIDLVAANIRGVIASGLTGDDDFSVLDEWSYEDWLRANRVAERTLSNPLVRGAHDLCFAYRDGNVRAPDIAAGQALYATCRFFFTYKGALFWRMKAGMGDVLFAPMYLALRRRGVRFRFFHRLDDIVLDASGKGVAELHFAQQVTLGATELHAPTNYRPLFASDGRHPMPVWRTTPDRDQLIFDDETWAEYDRKLAAGALDFESIWCDWPHQASVIATIGAPRADSGHPSIGHFDDVVVTVPVAALRRVSGQLVTQAAGAAGRRWSAMLDNTATVATQSVQLWVTKLTRDLGWRHGQVILSAFTHPFDTWADMLQLLEVENQPEAHGVHYLCSVLPEWQLPQQLKDGGFLRANATDLVKARKIVVENARRFLDDWIFQLWPDAVHRYPNTFKWEFLVDAQDRADAQRLEAQYFVANVDPSQRYTQTLAGTTKYRLRPDGSGFAHLYIAGDWTDCGFNLGCVEAAVMSGRLASAALTGFPDLTAIPGHSDTVTLGL